MATTTGVMKPDRVQQYKTLVIGQGLSRVELVLGMRPAFSDDSPSKVKGNYVCPDHKAKVEQFYRCTDPQHEDGELLKTGQLEKGYIVGDKMVVLAKDEIDALAAMTDKTLEVDCWVEHMDSAWHDGTTHALWCGSDDDRHLMLYNVFMEGLRERGGAIIGKTADNKRTKEVAISYSPDLGVLVMNTLKYGDQLRAPTIKVIQEGVQQVGDPPPEMVEQFQQLMDAMAEPEYDMATVVDEVSERMAQVLADKAQGKQIKAPADKKEVPVADIQSALRDTVAAMKKQRGAKKPASKSRGKVAA